MRTNMSISTCVSLLLVLGLIGNSHVCHGGLTSSIAEALLRRVEKEVLPAQSALRSFLSTVDRINEKFHRPSIQIYNFRAVQNVEGECSDMADTLEVANRLAADFAYYVYNISVNEFAPQLQAVIKCEMRNPLLWIKCVYLEIKEVLQTIKYMRQPIDMYEAKFKELEASLKNEFNACEQYPYH